MKLALLFPPDLKNIAGMNGVSQDPGSKTKEWVLAPGSVLSGFSNFPVFSRKSPKYGIVLASLVDFGNVWQLCLSKHSREEH